MAGESVKVAVQILYVHIPVGGGLSAVQQYPRTHSMSLGDDAFYRVDGTQGIGDVHHGHQLGVFRQQRLECSQVQFGIIRNRDDLEVGTGLLCHQLPGHDVGVMLHGGDNNVVTGLEKGPTVAVRHQVDAFGGAAGPDNLVAARGVDKALHGFPRRFELAGCQIT